MKKALLQCPESFGHRVTGIGKRVLQIATLLEKNYQVTLAMKQGPKAPHGLRFEVKAFQHPPRKEDLSEFDLVYCNGLTFATLNALKHFSGIRLVDMIIPFFLEHQIMFQEKSEKVFRARQSVDLALLMDSLRLGDLFLTASRMQEDLYAGLYALTGKNLGELPMLRIPFYLEPRVRMLTPEPIHLAWIGGFWSWFNPQPLLAVLPEFMQRNPKILFSFVGCEHPFDSNLHQKESLENLKALEKRFPQQLAVKPWLDYESYLSFLKTVHQAVILHKDTAEARYCIRTRYFELMEEGIPLLCSPGGCLAPILEKAGAATMMNSTEPGQLLKALEACLEQALKPKARYSQIYPLFNKEALSATLLERLRQPMPQSRLLHNPYISVKPKPYYYKRFRIREAWAKGWCHFARRMIGALRGMWN